MKRLFDILFSLLLLIPGAPVMLLAMIAIRLESAGDPLFRQTRIGQGTRPFTMLKLRTMVADAETLGGYATAAGDPRITRVGRILRRTSLDELPQLLNVLRGDMSVVGPRPDTPAQQDLYASQDWQRRHQVRPGLTGLAQATRRSSATPEERLALDLDYVADHGLGRDLNILWMTAQRLFANTN